MSEPRDDPNGFFLSRGIEPRGLEWDLSPSSLRLAYWKQVGKFAAIAKDGELASGLDRNGAALRPIRPSTRLARLNPHYSPMGIANPNAPPLTPCYEASRTRSLLRYKAYVDGVAFYWDHDTHTGASWGIILGYHRIDGRDVIGLSPNAVARVKRRALAWWTAYLNRTPGFVRPEVKARQQKTPNRVPIGGPPAKGERKPIAPYMTPWHIYQDGKLVDFAVAADAHIDFLSSVGVKARKR